MAWGFNNPPYVGPVGVNFWFYVGEPRFRQVTADLTNLTKAAEDALQGVVISNDSHVCATHSERQFVPSEEEQRVFIEVWALPIGYSDGPVLPGPFAFRPWDWGDTSREV